MDHKSKLEHETPPYIKVGRQEKRSSRHGVVERTIYRHHES